MGVPQFSRRLPSEKSVRDFISSHAHSGYSYEEVGESKDRPPSGYHVDRHRIRLGAGEETFQRAKDAIDRWEMFPISWVRVFPSKGAPEVGDTVTVFAKVFGLWIPNLCRVVYRVCEEATVERYGFAYGTLDFHLERGEERFLVEWDRNDDSVWYDLLAFSRPNHWLVRLGGPIARKFQRRFALDSMAAIRNVVEEGESCRLRSKDGLKQV